MHICTAKLASLLLQSLDECQEVVSRVSYCFGKQRPTAAKAATPAPAQSWQHQENICPGPPSLWKAAPILSSHPRDRRAAAGRCEHPPTATEKAAASATIVVFYHRGLGEEQAGLRAREGNPSSVFDDPLSTPSSPSLPRIPLHQQSLAVHHDPLASSHITSELH